MMAKLAATGSQCEVQDQVWVFHSQSEANSDLTGEGSLAAVQSGWRLVAGLQIESHLHSLLPICQWYQVVHRGEGDEELHGCHCTGHSLLERTEVRIFPHLV